MPNRKMTLPESTKNMTKKLEKEMLMIGEGRPIEIDIRKAQKKMAKRIMSRAAEFKKNRK
tara:strand:- start:483 stop:662 length:180 start_codon:yes stop_codon:yes gene_type:complete